MDSYLLPATTYQSPPRLARKQTLNTIIEDEFSEREDCSEDEREASGRGRSQHLRPARSTSTSPVPSLTSTISSYYKSSRRSEDFDDLYDVSDDDSEISLSVMTSISSHSEDSVNESPPSKSKTSRYPSLVIPSPGYWPTVQKAQALSPPRPPKIPISPAALSMLGHDLPSVSHPPSLDGSLNSDPFAGASVPVTPELQLHPKRGEIWGDVAAGKRNQVQKPELRIHINDGADWQHDLELAQEDGVSVHDFAMEVDRELPDSPVLGSEDGFSDVGVQLPADALDTLKHLSLETPDQPDFASPTDSEAEMEEVDMAFSHQCRPSSADITPMSQTSEYSMSGMSIPSPGGFFSSLGSNARHTWALADSNRMSTLPPSSTTAEQFYNCPWKSDFPATVAQVVEVDDNDTDGPPTARQIPPRAVEESLSQEARSPETPRAEAQDENYEQAIQEMAEKSLDRTSVWLAAQTSYMSTLRETYPASEVGLSVERSPKRRSHIRDDSLGSPIQKAVRFLEGECAKREITSAKRSGEGESIYYHAFQHVQAEQNRSDAFRHRHARAGSVQTSRISLPHEHLAALKGEFQITHVERPDSRRPISMFPGKASDQPEETAEQKVIARVGRERQALEQVNSRMWVIEAAKYLNGGKLLNSPVLPELSKAPALGDVQNGKVKSPARILDLGGQPNGDWAWHASREYQNARVYTASVDPQLIDTGIRGPRNHRRVAVTSLWQLPYPDNYFDVISARSLFSHLKTDTPLGHSSDEYDLCLQECLRCLKPNGYLEWFMMDSEIVNAGTLGTAASVEFGFNLKTRGYDPVPTKSWLGRVRRAGFDDIKRAWTFLPMGTPTKEPHMLPETPPPNVSTFESGNLEAVHGPVGSTADAAGMSGLVGSWAWEQWMVRLQEEMGKECVLEGVGAALEEGKGTGAGWRCLSGWARKPAEV